MYQTVISRSKVQKSDAEPSCNYDGTKDARERGREGGNGRERERKREREK